MSDDDTWRAALRAARAAWPEVGLDVERFTAAAEAHRRDGGAALEHLADLYLATAVATGDTAALRAFDARVLAGVDAAVARIDRAPEFLDELRQVLRVHLLVGGEDGGPRIATYRGGGPLLGWVRVAAVRTALNLKRALRPTVSVDEMLGELIAREPDPEIRHLKTLYRAELGDTLRASLAALPERQRALLRLHYVDGLKLAQIGALYKVTESTASRWVSAAVDAVADSTRQRLRDRLALSPSSVDSVAALVRSDLDLSISRILRES